METVIQFQNRQNKWLRGMIHRPSRVRSRRGVPGVVFFHGFTGDRMESHWLFVKCARALAEAGIASLRFDFYGSGESEGNFSEVTLQSEISDAQGAVDFFRRQKGIDPDRLGLLGLSLGGSIAATVAAQSRIQALVLWSALARPAELRKLAETEAKEVAGMKGALEYNGHIVSARLLEGVDGVDPLQAIAAFHGPTLIIHPERDELVPLSHPDDYFRMAGAAIKERVIISGADHTFTSVAWEREVIQRSVDWLVRHLAKHLP